MGGWFLMPLRKPLCIIAVFYVLGLSTASFVLEWPVHEGVVTMLAWVVPVIVGGYYGSSAYEHCNGPREGD